MSSQTTWQVSLARVPGARIVPEDFALAQVSSPAPAESEVLVSTQALGLNAGLRHRLGTGRSTTLGPALEPGDVPHSDGVATVVASKHPGFPRGSRVVGLLPWRGLASVPTDALRRVDDLLPMEELLTIRGHVGLTAHVALTHVGGLRAGETVWISAAAGGVGTCAVQLAMSLGARVIASAGGAERTRFLAAGLGAHHVLDRGQELSSQLDAAAPRGIDLYLDLVGGKHLEVALPRLRDRGRVVLVGRTANEDNAILLDHPTMIRRRLAVLGMSVTDHPDALASLYQLLDHMTPALRPVATMWHSPAALGNAFAALLTGGALGRAIVDVRESGVDRDGRQGKQGS